MGRRYYCDYCDKSFIQTPDAVKKHINGVVHKRLRDEYYAQFEDPATMIERESKKKPCRNFFESGQCQFGTACRFSHYSRQQLEALQWEVAQKNDPLQSADSNPTFESWLMDRKKRGLPFSDRLKDAFFDAIAKSSEQLDLAEVASWNYPQFLDYRTDLPPSLQRITLKNFQNVEFSEWGDTSNAQL